MKEKGTFLSTHWQKLGELKTATKTVAFGYAFPQVISESFSQIFTLKNYHHLMNPQNTFCILNFKLFLERQTGHQKHFFLFLTVEQLVA